MTIYEHADKKSSPTSQMFQFAIAKTGWGENAFCVIKHERGKFEFQNQTIDAKFSLSLFTFGAICVIINIF